MTAKPICVIRISKEARETPAGQEMQFCEFQKTFEDRLPDYHVFVIPMKEYLTEPQEFFTFQVFYEKDFSDIQYAELKELITQSLTNVKQ